METSSTSQPARSQPAGADEIEPKAHGDRHFKPVITPGFLKSPLVPAWLSRLFRRRDTPVAR